MTEAPGIICLANDPVYDFLVALAESVRRHSDLPLAVIPFDERMSKVRSLERRGLVEILDHPWFPELDRLGARLWPGRAKAPHAFRKIAAFDSRFDHFLFLDADIVLLRDPLRFIESHARDDPDGLWCFDTGEGQAYRPGPMRERMVAAGFPGVSTGSFIARRGLITLDQALETARSAEPVREEFLELAEQPFLNFMFETLRIPVTKVGDRFADV